MFDYLNFVLFRMPMPASVSFRFNIYARGIDRDEFAHLRLDFVMFVIDMCS